MNSLTTKEIIKFYKALAKGNFRAAHNVLKGHTVYTLGDRQNFFKGSEQGQGIYVFTDEARAMEYLAQEKNAGLNTVVLPADFDAAFYRAACVDHCNLYINITPKGNRDLFMVYRSDEDKCFQVSKNRDGHYTLPYGLEPEWEDNVETSLKDRERF